MRKLWFLLVAPVFLAAGLYYQGFMDGLRERATRVPDAVRGLTWEVPFRGDGVRYVEFYEYLIAIAPLYVAPVGLLAMLIYLFNTRRDRH